MIRIGVVAFLVGAICTLVALSPLVTGSEPPSALWFLAMLMGVGFLLILLGLWHSAHRRGATVRKAASGGAG